MEIICNLPNNKDLYITTIFCKTEKDFRYLNIYIKETNNNAELKYEEKKIIIAQNNIEKIRDLAKNSNYSEENLHKIKRNIIEQFNNSKFLLYIADYNGDIDSNIIESIKYTNNLLFTLGVSIKLFYNNDTSKYITLGKDLTILPSKYINKDNDNDCLLCSLIEVLICSENIIDFFNEIGINHVLYCFCHKCYEIKKFCTYCIENDETIKEIILCRKILYELTLLSSYDLNLIETYSYFY